jgi:hypothetical protein
MKKIELNSLLELIIYNPCIYKLKFNLLFASTFVNKLLKCFLAKNTTFVFKSRVRNGWFLFWDIQKNPYKVLTSTTLWEIPQKSQMLKWDL